MIPVNVPPIIEILTQALAEAETRSFIDYVRSMAGNESGLVLPVITPRFIPSCTRCIAAGTWAARAADRLPRADALFGERLGP